MKINFLEHWKPTFSKLNKTASLLFKVIFTNPRTYIFVFIFSGLLSILCSWLWNTYSFFVILPPILINFLSISVFVASFYLGLYLVEWRRKQFLKKIKLINLHQYHIIIVVFLLNVALTSISVLINIILYNIYSLIPIFNFHLPLLSNIRAFVWVLYIIGMIMLTFFLTLLYVWMATAISNRNWSFATLTIVTLFLLIFSDVILQPTITNKMWPFIILGYLCPTKYFIWFNMLFTSYQFLDPLGISQIIQDFNQVSFIVFNQVWEPFLGIVVFIGIFSYLAPKYFTWGMKG
ncbi:hypothetical protein [Spiroplasma sp. DGKH1]|uniref:hypothetical protein n=1 Tax=Spiroplasma sp. DGKH1 TaxID=3050074 RepID=UPI0034C5C24B